MKVSRKARPWIFFMVVTGLTLLGLNVFSEDHWSFDEFIISIGLIVFGLILSFSIGKND